MDFSIVTLNIDLVPASSNENWNYNNKHNKFVTNEKNEKTHITYETSSRQHTITKSIQASNTF